MCKLILALGPLVCVYLLGAGVAAIFFGDFRSFIGACIALIGIGVISSIIIGVLWSVLYILERYHV